MKLLFLYPSDYFDVKQIDSSFSDEYETMQRFPEFMACTFGYDAFVADGTFSFYPRVDIEGLCIYRGWMLTPEQYQLLYAKLANRGIQLINSPEAYLACHLFPYAYSAIKDFTPTALWFSDCNDIDWDVINHKFKRFMIKDYVKSVKGSDFPVFFETPVIVSDMESYLDRFVDLRGSLFTGGFLFKEFVSLKRYSDHTNEYRAFYLDGHLLTLSKNSNQPECSPVPPLAFVEQFSNLPSRFYTVDFAEQEDGKWIVIETGDGQVSGLSPNQYVFKYYDEIRMLKILPN